MENNRFSKASWINQTNVYEVNLRQYSAEGTLDAFRREMPRLRAMGVETLWFMPLTPISMKNRKGSLGSYYACSDYTAINPEFGTKEGFKDLVQYAHAMGFKVIIDWVANHTGWDHTWTVTNPEYYKTDKETGTFRIASGMDDIIELDFDNQAMRNAMISAMSYWITEFDIDGFRCDLAFWVRLDFWMEARAALEKIKTLFWLAETDPLEFPEYLGAFDSAYTWSWMHKTADYYQKRAGISELKDLIKKYSRVCAGESLALWFTSNHDENSWNGTEYEKYGNMLMALNVFSFTWNGIPLIYSGQELPNLKRLAFFDKDPIGWGTETALFDFYRCLLQLRNRNPALRAGDGKVITEWIENNLPGHLVAFSRIHLDDCIIVLLNFSEDMISFQWNETGITGEFKNVFSGELTTMKPGLEIELPAWGYLLLEK